MGQILTNRTGREKILIQGEKPEIKITAKQEGQFLSWFAEINLDPAHKFKDDYRIKIQAYEKNGVAKKPTDMGTVKEPKQTGQALIKEIHIDRVLFRLKIIDKDNKIRGYAQRIPLTNDDPRERQKKFEEQSSTILPIQETNNINVPYKIQLSLNEKPILLLKANLNLKERFKNDIHTKTLIYSAAIREILIKYLTDKEFANDKNKKDFINTIKNNCAGDVQDEPTEMIEEGQKLSEDGLNWIEYVTERCLNKPVNFQGKQISLMDQFKDDCINHNVKGDDDDEN